MNTFIPELYVDIFVLRVFLSNTKCELCLIMNTFIPALYDDIFVKRAFRGECSTKTQSAKDLLQNGPNSRCKYSNIATPFEISLMFHRNITCVMH